MIAQAPTQPPRRQPPPVAIDFPDQLPPGTEVGVRWSVPGGRTVICPGVFIAFVPALDTPYRVLVRATTPRGATTLIEAHPDSIDFEWRPQ